MESIATVYSTDAVRIVDMIQSTVRQLSITWHYLWDVTKRRTRIVFQEMGKFPEYVAISDTWAGGG